MKARKTYMDVLQKGWDTILRRNLLVWCLVDIEVEVWNMQTITRDWVDV